MYVSTHVSQPMRSPDSISVSVWGYLIPIMRGTVDPDVIEGFGTRYTLSEDIPPDLIAQCRCQLQFFVRGASLYSILEIYDFIKSKSSQATYFVFHILSLLKYLPY